MLGCLKKEVFYPYPPQRVWQVLTSQAALATWLMKNDFKPCVGHKFQFIYSSIPDFEESINCQVIELEEPRRLSFTWQDKMMCQPSIVTWTLKAVDGGTELHLEHTHPGISTIEQLKSEPNIFEAATTGKDFTDEAVLMEFCFHDFQPDVARWAISKQCPQQSTAHLFEKNPLKALPSVECKYIIGADDRIISPAWSRHAARKHLGADAIELPSGHYPHISCPDLLASILLDCSI